MTDSCDRFQSSFRDVIGSFENIKAGIFFFDIGCDWQFHNGISNSGTLVVAYYFGDAHI
tara:strand:- start:230 stop:406 length:177 start_codon:yes stop_codon:yes gene_type:complete